MQNVSRPSTISPEEAAELQGIAVEKGVATEEAAAAVEAATKEAVREVSEPFRLRIARIEPDEDEPETRTLYGPLTGFPRLWVPPREENHDEQPEVQGTTTPPSFHWAFVKQKVGDLVQAARTRVTKKFRPPHLSVHDPHAPRTLKEMQASEVENTPHSAEKYPDPDDALGVYGSGEENNE